MNQAIAQWIMTEAWIDAASKFGIPVVILAVVGWFLGKRVWPWMVSQVEKTQAAREKDLDRFSQQIVEQGKEQIEALRDLSAEVRSHRKER
jgi:hypothetical protein